MNSIRRDFSAMYGHVVMSAVAMERQPWTEIWDILHLIYENEINLWGSWNNAAESRHIPAPIPTNMY